MKNLIFAPLIFALVLNSCSKKKSDVAVQNNKTETVNGASQGCTDAKINDLAQQFIKKDLLETYKISCKEVSIVTLQRTDPANIEGEHKHYVVSPKCDGEWMYLYLLKVKQNFSAVDDTMSCEMSQFKIPDTVAYIEKTPETWTIDQFISELEASKFKSIEEALQSLPESVRSSFTLMYETHGLRGSTPEKPAVVLFSNTGDYAITFGDQSQKLGNEFEIFKFDKKTNQGELIRAEFLSEAEIVGDKSIQVERNPKQCLKCHGADPMMLWGSYPKWDGAYGSNDDSIASADTPNAESENFQKFMQVRWNLPRYNSLLLPKAETGLFPYWDNSPVSPYTNLYKDGRSILRPNFRLNVSVALVNANRMARKMMQSAQYAGLRKELLALMIGCSTDDPRLLAILKDLGITIEDLQPNILDPIPANGIPNFTDGFTGYAGAKNGLIDYAASVIFDDLAQEIPELKDLLYKQVPADFLSKSYWTFGVYQSTVQHYTDVSKLGSTLYATSEADGKAVCEKLKN